MKLERTTTGLIIHGPDAVIKRKILQYFSLVNPVREFFIYSGNDPNASPIFGKERDVVYISSGFLNINDNVIKTLPRPSVIAPRTPATITLKMNRQPRSKLQEDAIQMMTQQSPEQHKTTVELKPGTGKTFIATYAISILKLKPLIIAPTSLLKNQWCSEFKDVGILETEIATSLYDAPKKKVCVVTMSAVERLIRDDWINLIRVLDESAFGIKVVDEAHLHLKGVLKFDAICNIPYNWYLSATLGRSDVQEDNILNRALSDAQKFVGSQEYEEYQKQYVTIYCQDIYYKPSSKLCAEYFRYGNKGLIKSTYYRMLMVYKNGIPFYANIIYMAKIARQTITYDGKVLILIPLISIIDKIIEMMGQDQYFSKYKFAGVDGSMSLSERRNAMESDFILSTSLSMGTGVDVQNLAAVVNFDQYSSSIITEQIFGRLRDRGKETWYFDVTDHVKQAKMFESWGRKRRSIIPYFPGANPTIKQLPDINS